MMDASAYIKRETRVSVLINAVLSFTFFMLIFGLSSPVSVWGVGQYVFDFAPQALLIGMMATLVPGALAGRALRKGAVRPYQGVSHLPSALWPRALLVGMLAMVVAVAGSAAVLAALGISSLPPVHALIVKVLFGGTLGLVVTPPGLRAALRREAA